MLGREVPFPSIADIGYLAFVPLAAAALLAFPSVPRRLSSRIRTVLDGLLIASALLFMSWMVVLGPLFDAGGDPLTLTIGLAYPLGDVVIITILLFASSHRSQRAVVEPGQPAAALRRAARVRRRRQRVRAT